MKLRPYQEEGRDWLSEITAGMLADEMRLGKSAQSIRACDDLMARRVLVLCPASVKEVWRREFARWSTTRINPEICSYHMAHKIEIPPSGWDVVILDEAHYLKNREANRTKAIYGEKCTGEGNCIVSFAEHAWTLTGTPMPNNPSELWTHLRALRPDIITGRSGKPAGFWAFAKRYCNVQNNGFGLQISGGRNLDELKTILTPFVKRRRMVDVVAEVPAMSIDTLPLAAELIMPKHLVTQQTELGRALDETDLEDKQLAARLAGIMGSFPEFRRWSADSKVQPLAAWIIDFLENSDEKIVIMGHHREALQSLKALLGDYGAVLVQGGVSDTLRTKYIDRFGSDPECRVFIGQIQSAGVGVPLHAANTLIFLEASPVPGENDQAMKRIQAVEKKDPLQIYFSYAAGTIDQRIQEILAGKSAVINEVFN